MGGWHYSCWEGGQQQPRSTSPTAGKNNPSAKTSLAASAFPHVLRCAHTVVVTTHRMYPATRLRPASPTTPLDTAAARC